MNLGIRQNGTIKEIGEDGKEKEVVVGISFNRDQSPSDYLDNIGEYDLFKTNIKKQMEICEKIYTFEGIVGTMIDLMVDIANTPLIIQDLEDEKALEVLKGYIENVNTPLKITNKGTNKLIEQGMTQWLVYGNCFPYKSWRNYKVDGKTLLMPNINFLNPRRVTIDEGLLALGVKKIYYNIEGVSDKSFKKYRSMLLKNVRKSKKQVDIELPLKNVDHLKRKGFDWKAFGVPFLVRSFAAISSKKKLRALDDATTEGLINYLTIFKIGSPDPASPYHSVDSSRLKAFANLLNNPTASTTLIWTHDLEVDTLGPDGKVLELKDKYMEVDADILKSLGVGANLFTAFDRRDNEETVLMFIETLETMRDHFIEYLTELFKDILEANDLPYDNFSLKFSSIRLADVLQKTKNIILSYYDRGLLSYETALSMGGYSFKQELERKKKEQSIKKKGLFDVPNLPFSNNGSDGRPTDNTKTSTNKKDNNIKLDTKTEKTNKEAAETYMENYYRKIRSVFNRKDALDMSHSTLLALLEEELNTVANTQMSSLTYLGYEIPDTYKKEVEQANRLNTLRLSAQLTHDYNKVLEGEEGYELDKAIGDFENQVNLYVANLLKKMRMEDAE